MKFNKSDLIKRIAVNMGLPEEDIVKPIIDVVFEEITEEMANGNSVGIDGFGVFYPRPYKERSIKDPFGNETYLEARMSPRFRASNVLKERLKSKKS